MERELQAIVTTDAPSMHPQGSAGSGWGAEKRHAGAARDACFTSRRWPGGVGAVPEAVRLRDRRLAAGEVAAIAAAKADGADREFYAAKIRTARFYAAQVLPGAAALARVVESGGMSVVETGRRALI